MKCKGKGRKKKYRGRGETIDEKAEKQIVRNNLGENNIKALEKLQEPSQILQEPGSIAQPLKSEPLRKKPNFITRAKNYVKKNKIISRGTRALSHFYDSKGLSILADEIEQAGYGRVIKKRKNQRGGRRLGPTLRDRYGAYVEIPGLINS